MDATYQLLLALFEEVAADPTCIPQLPSEQYEEGGDERRLLDAFQHMLARVRESQEGLRKQHEALINTIDGIVWEADARTVEFSFVSQKVERLLGYSASEWMSKPSSFWQEHIYPDDLEWAPAFCATATAAKRNHEFEYRMVAADGRVVWLRDIVSVVVENGEPVQLRGVMVDITEHKHAQEALEKLRRQHELILRSAGDGIFGTDKEGRTTFVNPAAARMLGWEPEEMIGRPQHDFLRPTRADGTPYPAGECPIEATLRDGTVYAVDTDLFRRKDGTTFPVEYTSTPILEDGEIVGAVLTFKDSAERIKAQEQLREKEAQYRSIFEATSDGMVIHDGETGLVVEVNPAFARMHGRTVEEFVGLSYTEFVHPDSYHLFLHYLDSMKSGRQPRGEVGEHDFQTEAVHIRKDGTSFPIEVHSTRFTYMGKPYYLSVVRDITERVKSQEQLREKEAQYRGIFEATSDGMVINEAETGLVVEVNPAFARMHGRTVEEFVGLTHLDFVHPDSQHLFLDYLDTVRAGREFRTEAFDIRKDGTSFPIEVHGTGFTYKGKSHCLGVVRDITERKEAEKRLREQEEQYYSVFEATTDGLFINCLDGRLIDFNPAAARMHGYTVDEFRVLQSSDFVHPDSFHLYEEYIATIKEGRTFRGRAIDIHKDGSFFHVEVVGQPFMYRGVPHGLAVVRDVTAEVEAYQLLERRVAERTAELSTLLQVSQNVASTLELRPLLNLILDQLKAVTNYTGATISTLDGDDLVFLEYRGPASHVEEAPAEVVLPVLRFPTERWGILWDILQGGTPCIIADVLGDDPMAQAFRAAWGEHLDTTLHYVRSLLAVPLMVKDRIIGSLSISFSQPSYYTSRHAELALAIANQAAIAIENARLYEKAHALAALEERQRLARELHDSVSQALYGIALGSYAARSQLDKDREGVAKALEYVNTLAEAGLAEMRALIFELRPESLETEGLVAALTKQADSLHARHRIEVQTDVSAEPPLPLEAKEALYRVAQEALHNTIKHARAKQVCICLTEIAGNAVLELRDDGAGFDHTASFPGHLGLRSMQERVAQLGGTLEIESEPGRGTTIRAQVPLTR